MQVVLCSLRLPGSVVCTRFAVCFDHDHAFSLYLCCGRVWALTGSSTFVKVILIIQGLGSAIEQGCLSSTVSQWVSNMDQVNWVGIKGVPLARSDWMASCVSDCESGLVNCHSSRCVVQFWRNFVWDAVSRLLLRQHLISS